MSFLSGLKKPAEFFPRFADEHLPSQAEGSRRPHPLKISGKGHAWLQTERLKKNTIWAPPIHLCFDGNLFVLCRRISAHKLRRLTSGMGQKLRRNEADLRRSWSQTAPCCLLPDDKLLMLELRRYGWWSNIFQHWYPPHFGIKTELLIFPPLSPLNHGFFSRYWKWASALLLLRLRRACRTR